MSKKLDFILLDSEWSNGTQGISLTQIWSFGKKKCKTSVYLDSYNQQCKINGYLFDPVAGSWNHLASISPDNSDIVAKKVFCYRPVKDMLLTEKKAFSNDADELLHKLQLIIS